MASAPRKSEEPGQLSTELNAEQALGLVSYSLMQRLAREGQTEMPWLETDDSSHAGMVRQLRQRLELTSLAVDSGAPLTTAEVTYLLGARPGTESVERGGLTARRVSRNVWRLSRMDDSSGRGSSFADDRFRRRL
ncbi:hypothetical protein MITS9509_00781 [Synechococcus sp. MIT S9509]|uniref:hypothetical protein n=1 Tax=unclassified Synechococcus TaxID=2626047 RepID=UPI0007BB05D2|nr:MULTISPECIES: hypothetical protein [unclassified Synechococcus]KZR86838.1 hypothetical protein MITS9504_00924 [Synechococcus sp. MIT S9504]KZR92908.1 hypothetical protein MITS9509_00781 [Synechococcus sp. MIT S9509]